MTPAGERAGARQVGPQRVASRVTTAAGTRRDDAARRNGGRSAGRSGERAAVERVRDRTPHRDVREERPLGVEGEPLRPAGGRDAVAAPRRVRGGGGRREYGIVLREVVDLASCERGRGTPGRDLHPVD